MAACILALGSRQPAYEHQQEKYQDKEDNIGHFGYPREHEEFLKSKSKTACFPVWCATLKIKHPFNSVWALWEHVGVRPPDYQQRQVNCQQYFAGNSTQNLMRVIYESGYIFFFPRCIYSMVVIKELSPAFPGFPASMQWEPKLTERLVRHVLYDF